MSKIEFCIKALLSVKTTRLKIKWRRPTLPLLRSTIGATRLNFSVRNRKRWNPCAITTLINRQLTIVLMLLYRSIASIINFNNYFPVKENFIDRARRFLRTIYISNLNKISMILNVFYDQQHCQQYKGNNK